MRATHQPIAMEFSGSIITLKPGQLITSRKSLSGSCGVSESKIERVLGWMKIEQQIEQQGGNRSRLITITNWNQYQAIEQQIEQISNNHRTTTEQPPDTNKNEKKERIEINTGAADRKSQKSWPTLSEVLLYADKIGLPPDEAQKFFDHFEGTGWTDKNGHPIHDWQSKCRTWKVSFEERKFKERGGAKPKSQLSAAEEWMKPIEELLQ